MDPQTITYDNKREMEQEALRRTFIQIPMEIFYDIRLTPNDKIIYGRISTFDEFFESRAHTAELLNVSTKQIQRSITKLLELGYIEFIHNDGRGNRYRATEAPLRKLRMARSQKVHDIPTDTRMDEIDPSWTNCLNERTKCPQNRTKCPTEYKESINGEENSLIEDKSSIKAPAPTDESEIGPLKEEQPKSYGKAEINDLLELWREETGFDHKSAKAERYAINNLLRKNGYEATKALIRRVGRARRSDNQFAPQIAKPSQLQGKYSKLEALVIWEEREAKKQQAEIDAKPAGPVVPRFTPYEDAREGKTEEELRAECQAIRDKYKGTKFEKIFGGRK